MMDLRQICGRFKCNSRKRQMIHLISNSSYRHKCKSSSMVQVNTFIKREDHDIKSENQREKSFDAVSSGNRLKLSSIQLQN